MGVNPSLAWSWLSGQSGCFLLWLSALAVLRVEWRRAAEAVAKTWSGGGPWPPARAARRRRAALMLGGSVLGLAVCLAWMGAMTGVPVVRCAWQDPRMSLSPRPVEAVATVATDAGMLALWDPKRFTGIVDYDTWDAQLGEDEDIERHIRTGALAPINIRSDGAFGVVVRIGGVDQPAQLTERETRHCLVTSDAYLLQSSGQVWLSGIEAVGAEAGSETVRFDLPAGRCSVVIHLIAWEDEPGSVNEDGTPSETALSDFVAVINPAAPEQDNFRSSVETFDRPED